MSLRHYFINKRQLICEITEFIGFQGSTTGDTIYSAYVFKDFSSWVGRAICMADKSSG